MRVVDISDISARQQDYMTLQNEAHYTYRTWYLNVIKNATHGHDYVYVILSIYYPA